MECCSMAYPTRRCFLFRAVGLVSLNFQPEAFAQTGCRFTPLEPAVRLLRNGRDVELIERYEYVDSNGRSWPVPAGTVVDGASIPQPFWSIIGGPFEGLYRGPS